MTSRACINRLHHLSAGRAFTTLLLCAMGVASSGCDNRNFVVTSETVCRPNAGIDDPCRGADQYWQDAVDNLLEVIAVDFASGDYVGAQCQGETAAAWDWFPFWFNSWQPVDGYKHRMVGTLHHFNWNYDDDEDWNLHVVPEAPFSFLVSDVEGLHPESTDEHDKCGGPQCMEAEISPDREFWSNPWFIAPGDDPADTDGNGVSRLEGRQLGLYGLWIVDANHDSKSELHPAEQFWFKDHFAQGFGSSQPFDVFWLLFMQDNTGRFDDRDNFDCDGDAPAGWQPWSQSPRSGEFKVAFLVDPRNEVVDFTIVELFRRFVVTSQNADARRDADDGKSHGLEYNGRVVVRVQEDQPDDNDLGVTFTNVLLRADGKLQGFVSIRSMIGGDDDKDEEGFHILYVVRSVSSTGLPVVPKPDLVALPRVLIKSQEVDGSIRNVAGVLAGDLRLTMHGSDATTERDSVVSRVELVTGSLRQELKFEQDTRTHDVLVRDVPLRAPGALLVTTASGVASRVPVATMRLAPGILIANGPSVADSGAGQFLPGAVGGIPMASLPYAGPLLRLQEAHLSLKPRYAAHKGNEVVTDRAAPFAGEINRAIMGSDVAKLENLLRTDRPFTVSWSFEAINLANGKPVPLSIGERRDAAGVHIDVRSGRLGNDSVTVVFPATGSAGIIELVARARVTDTTGDTVVVEGRVWSHALQSVPNGVDEVVALVRALSGIRDTLTAPAAPSRDGRAAVILPSNANARRAYITNAYLRDAMRDRQITMGELRKIVRSLRATAPM